VVGLEAADFTMNFIYSELLNVESLEGSCEAWPPRTVTGRRSEVMLFDTNAKILS
jgi:hypothetical protein